MMLFPKKLCYYSFRLKMISYRDALQISDFTISM